jgi:short-subunit dehydrogenase
VLEGGKIINISSMSSFGHFPFISPYCASKRALDIFFNAFAIENHRNIKVISIKPGVIATPIWQKSVQSNEKLLNDCTGYEKEMEFMKTNALKNTQKGLNVSDVASFIKKVAYLKNPKASYTLGKDAKFAQILSYLPQDVINSLVKFGLKSRISAHDKE